MIDFDAFLDWAESRFESVKVHGDEVMLNSIFTEDNKNKLWCNPRGGKNTREGGVYHCWKTGEKGTLLKLVMKVDGCAYDEAQHILQAQTGFTLAELEEKVRKMFEDQHEVQNEISVEIKLPPYTYFIEELPKNNYYRQRVEKILNERKIPIEGLMVCTEGRYRNRIVIPWRNREGHLVYYNARTTNNSIPKYMALSRDSGVNKGDFLYCYRWPPKQQHRPRVYVVEGEFDAITLNQCGYFSFAFGGKELTNKQLELLKDYQITLSFDNDKAGKGALHKTIQRMLEQGFTDINKIRPPIGYKDWNALYVDVGQDTLSEYIKANETMVDSFELDLS